MSSTPSATTDRYPLFTGLSVAIAACVLSAGVVLLGGIEIARQVDTGFGPVRTACVAAAASTACERALGLNHVLQQRIPVMLLMQGLSFVLMLGAAVLIVVRARDALMVRPLAALRFGSDVRTVEGHDEIERLLNRLKHLAARQTGEQTQERWAQQLTAERARRHADTVRILHAVSRMYSRRHLSEASLASAIELLGRGLGARTAAVDLHGAARAAIGATAIVGTGGEPAWFARESSPMALRDGGARMVASEAAGGVQSLVVPLACAEVTLGTLVAEFGHEERIDDIHIQLVEAFAQITALAISVVSHSQEERRVALMEERSAIAGELHDSLAQSLAFMKIQVARLQGGLSRSEQPPDVTQAAQELRTGLSTAYREVRELIAAFRVRMGPGGLVVAVGEAVEEFSQRSDFDIALDADLGRCHLEVNEEFHVLQVVREALSNAVRHARAQHVWIALRYGPGHHVVVTVDDDGRGPNTPRGDARHHGQNIMHERAVTLGGDLSIVEREGGGTRVLLSFPPQRLPLQLSEIEVI